MNEIKNEEIELPNKAYMTSMTDLRGHIVYINEHFCNINGYSKGELLGKNHNIVRHPDMPRVIFKYMWERLYNNKGFVGYVKNKAKDGRYYWTVSEIEMVEKNNNKFGYYSFRSRANKYGIEEISKLYDTLRKLEKDGTMEDSEEYLDEFLQARGFSYDEYIKSLMKGDRVKLWYGALKHFLT
jgi:PAS domain S-box-containing protein